MGRSGQRSSNRRQAGASNPAAFHVRGEEAGKTLGQVVRQHAGVSWSEAERLILARRVGVHGNLCLDPARRLKVGDVVHVHAESLAKLPEADDLEIVFEDRHLIVVDKPARVTSVRERREAGLSQQRRDRQPTLDELLDRRLRKNEPPHRRGKNARQLIYPVHRLDRDTSGLMLFAKAPDVEAELNRMFKTHAIDRAYRTVVRNGLPKEQTITTQLVRDRGDGLRGSINPKAPSGQPLQRAVTHVRPLKAIGDYGLIECRLETGRTHQIRIHLSEIGHPICGDTTYGDKRDSNSPPRQALHAYLLGFTHPITGKLMQFERDWPTELGRWLQRLQR